jgi:hypothetical protein
MAPDQTAGRTLLRQWRTWTSRFERTCPVFSGSEHIRGHLGDHEAENREIWAENREDLPDGCLSVILNDLQNMVQTIWDQRKLETIKKVIEEMANRLIQLKANDG